MLHIRCIVKSLNEDSPQSPVKIFHSLVKFADIIFKFLRRYHMDGKKSQLSAAQSYYTVLVANLSAELSHARDLF